MKKKKDIYYEDISVTLCLKLNIPSLPRKSTPTPWIGILEDLFVIKLYEFER